MVIPKIKMHNFFTTISNGRKKYFVPNYKSNKSQLSSRSSLLNLLILPIIICPFLSCITNRQLNNSNDDTIFCILNMKEQSWAVSFAIKHRRRKEKYFLDTNPITRHMRKSIMFHFFSE